MNLLLERKCDWSIVTLNREFALPSSSDVAQEPLIDSIAKLKACLPFDVN